MKSGERFFYWRGKVIVSIVLFFMVSCPAMSSKAQEVVLFSDASFPFQQPIADFRSMRTGMFTFWNDQSQHLFELQLGNTWNLIHGSTWSIEGRAGVLARFDINTPSFFLENTDLMGGLATAWQIGPGALECVLSHLSAHLGGDIAQSGLKEQVNVSRELATLMYSFKMGETFRFYGGPEVMVRADPRWMQGKVNLKTGLEWQQSHWVAAVHLCFHGDYLKDRLDITWLTGYDLSPSGTDVKQVLSLFVFNGHKLAGQYEAETETAVGLGIFLY